MFVGDKIIIIKWIFNYVFKKKKDKMFWGLSELVKYFKIVWYYFYIWISYYFDYKDIVNMLMVYKLYVIIWFFKLLYVYMYVWIILYV